MISGHPISICFRRLTSCQRDLWDRGVIAGYQGIGTRAPRALGTWV